LGCSFRNLSISMARSFHYLCTGSLSGWNWISSYRL